MSDFFQKTNYIDSLVNHWETPILQGGMKLDSSNALWTKKGVSDWQMIFRPMGVDVRSGELGCAYRFC